MIMKWLEDLIKDVKKSENQSIKVNGSIITLEDAQERRDWYLEMYEFYGNRIPLSLRRACIVILHEEYYQSKKYPPNLEIDKIYKKAKLRFEILNRSTKNLNYPHEIHPKNPCLFFEENAKRKASYRKALEILAIHSRTYFDDQEAVPSFNLLYEDIKLC